VANHTSGFDGIVLLKTLYADISLIVNDGCEKIPVIGTLCNFNQALFAPRGGTPAVKQKLVEMIEERQRTTESGKC